MHFFLKPHAIFVEKAQPVSSVVKTDPKKSLFFGYMYTWIKLETTYKPPQGPRVLSKVPFVTFEQPNWEAIGNNHMVSSSVFFVSSYILVFRYTIHSYQWWLCGWWWNMKHKTLLPCSLVVKKACFSSSESNRCRHVPFGNLAFCKV